MSEEEEIIIDVYVPDSASTGVKKQIGGLDDNDLVTMIVLCSHELKKRVERNQGKTLIRREVDELQAKTDEGEEVVG